MTERNNSKFGLRGSRGGLAIPQLSSSVVINQDFEFNLPPKSPQNLGDKVNKMWSVVDLDAMCLHSTSATA